MRVVRKYQEDLAVVVSISDETRSGIQKPYLDLIQDEGYCVHGGGKYEDIVKLSVALDIFTLKLYSRFRHPYKNELKKYL